MIDVNKKSWDWNWNSLYEIGSLYSDFLCAIDTLDNRLKNYYIDFYRSDNCHRFRIYYIDNDIIIHKLTIKEAERFLKISKL